MPNSRGGKTLKDKRFTVGVTKLLHSFYLRKGYNGHIPLEQHILDGGHNLVPALHDCNICQIKNLRKDLLE